MLQWLVVIFLFLVGYFITTSLTRTAYWRNKNVPGPTQWPLVGSFLNVALLGEGNFDIKCTKELGRFFGYFNGPTPVLTVSDLNALRSIMVKDFSHFVNRRTVDGVNGEVMDHALNILKDQRWKDVRSILVPTFTSGKLRQMNPLIVECCNTLTTSLEKIADEKRDFEAKGLFATVTMDVIASAFFGTKIDSQNDPRNEFVHNAHKGFGHHSHANPALILLSLFPQLLPYFAKLGVQFIPKDVVDFFIRNTNQIIKLRTETNLIRPDFLQLMLNSLEGTPKIATNKKTALSEVAEEHSLDVLSDFVSVAKETGETHPQGKLTTNELVAQAIIFFLAGHETTSSALSFITHALATNPDIQERLRQEIDDVLGDAAEPSYDRVAQMEYLDMVLNEVLRMYPPAARTDRVCNKDWEFNGIKVEKGTIVTIPIYAIHHDPEYWESPEKFDPERFSKKNKGKIKPYSFQTFGQGPRNCIGMRFAYFEMKMVIVSILRNYRIVPTGRTEIPLQLKQVGFVTPKNGVWVSLERLST